MSQQIFDRLLECLAGRVGVDAARLVAARVLDIDGVSFRFEWRSFDSEDALLAVCHFGPPHPSGDVREQFAKLLEVNLFLLDAEVVTYFAVDRRTGDIMLCIRAPLASLGVDTLEGSVVGAAGQARAWRSGQYVQEPSSD